MKTGFSYVPEGKVQRRQSQALFSVLSGKTRGSGYKLEHRRFLNSRKHFFFCCEGDQEVAQIARNVVESLFLQMFRSCLDTDQGHFSKLSLSVSLCENDTAWRKANASPLKQGISCKEWELLLLSEGLLTNNSRLKKGFVSIRKQ